jgi:FkbM family methyltransferase
MTERVIYDLGANVGLNIPYYLKKADRVIAVEANPALAQRLENSFSEEIRTGRVVVVNHAITSRADSGNSVDFYVYVGEKPHGHVISSLREPGVDRASDFERVSVSTVDLSSLIEVMGEPYFVKIDLEHHDAVVLNDMFSQRIFPPFLSVEAHDPVVVGLLLLEQTYRGFKVVLGREVPVTFLNHPVMTNSGAERWSFPRHSAGPFGEDLPGDWLDQHSLLKAIGVHGLGWVDIHASAHFEGARVEPKTPIRTTPDGVISPLLLAMKLSALAVGRAPGALRGRFLSPRAR